MHHLVRSAMAMAQPVEPAACQHYLAARRRVLAVATLCVTSLLATSAAFGEPSRYDTAQIDYEIGHFDKAFAVFASLADEGHCDAGRIARQMVRHGRPLYAIEFKVAPERLERWQRLPACPVAVAGGNAERRAP